jgi:hypothetical protein
MADVKKGKTPKEFASMLATLLDFTVLAAYMAS